MKICVSCPVDVCYVIIYTKKNRVNQNIEMLLMPPFFCQLFRLLFSPAQNLDSASGSERLSLPAMPSPKPKKTQLCGLLNSQFFKLLCGQARKHWMNRIRTDLKTPRNLTGQKLRSSLLHFLLDSPFYSNSLYTGNIFHIPFLCSLRALREEYCIERLGLPIYFPASFLSAAHPLAQNDLCYLLPEYSCQQSQ